MSKNVNLGSENHEIVTILTHNISHQYSIDWEIHLNSQSN